MNSRDFRGLFLYEWESKHKVITAAQNVNAAFGNGSINERTIQSCYGKFKTGHESLTNEDRERLETVVDNEIL